MTRTTLAWLTGILLATSSAPLHADETIPKRGDWAVGAGVWVTDFEVKFSRLTEEHGIGGGGMVAVEHWFHPAFSVELAGQVTPEFDTGVGVRNLFSTGDSLRGRLDLQVIAVTLGGKLYPLRLAKLERWRVQPYLIAGIGMLIVPLELTGSYTNPPDPPDFVRLSITETVGMWHVGLGADLRLTRRLNLFGDVALYDTFDEPEAVVSIPSASTRTGTRLAFRAEVARVGLKFRF